MKRQPSYLVGFVAVAIGATLAASSTFAQSVDTARIEAAGQNDWLTYHGSYKSHHYSPLAQINASNVANLNVAWIHIPGRSTRGLQSMPLVADGVLYYTGSYSRTFALNGATGELIWSYFPELDEALIARQTHSPYNRGVALGEGKVYVGTMDGRLIALDMKTGKVAWDTKLIDSQKLTVGFTGAPLYAKGTVVIGSQGGEWPGRGPIFGVDAATGKKKWEFLTVAGTDEAMKTWGSDSWRTGGGGGWMPGTYNSENNTVLWGTANPAPLYDWSGSDFKTQGARPGDNLYTTSVIALDVDTGKLKSYHQELPHDAWDFDSAVGEFVMLERDGQKLVVHPNKGGFIFVYDRNLAVKNVWRLVQNINFVKDIDPKTGELIGRRDFAAGKVTEPPLCPYIGGGVSWNSGSYSPKTGLYYKIGQEWCMTLDVAEDDTGDRPTGPAQHRRRFQDCTSSRRRDLWSSRRARPGDRGKEMGGSLPRAADCERAVDRGQSRVRARLARRGSRLRCRNGDRAVESLQRHRPSGWHRQLLRRRQAIYRHDRRLRRHAVGRLRRDVRRRLQEHAAR